MPEEREASKWLQFAQEDLRAAEIILTEHIHSQVCFHSQQCVEKILKGYLKSHGIKVPKTHSLVELITLCSKLDNNFNNFIGSCKILDQYYSPTRYPDAIPGILPDGLPAQKEAQEAIAIAKIMFDLVRKEIE